MNMKRKERENIIYNSLNGKQIIGENGKMIINYNNGDKYEGEYIDNIKEGKGIYYYNNGDKYEGEFVNYKKEGYGTYYYKSEEKYEGEFN